MCATTTGVGRARGVRRDPACGTSGPGHPSPTARPCQCRGVAEALRLWGVPVRPGRVASASRSPGAAPPPRSWAWQRVRAAEAMAWGAPVRQARCPGGTLWQRPCCSRSGGPRGSRLAVRGGRVAGRLTDPRRCPAQPGTDVMWACLPGGGLPRHRRGVLEAVVGRGRRGCHHGVSPCQHLRPTRACRRPPTASARPSLRLLAAPDAWRSGLARRVSVVCGCSSGTITSCAHAVTCPPVTRAGERVPHPQRPHRLGVPTPVAPDVAGGALPRGRPLARQGGAPAERVGSHACASRRVGRHAPVAGARHTSQGHAQQSGVPALLSRGGRVTPAGG